jgi:4-hydroxy-3-polyprenylbenzoate decarboxylase
MDKILASLMRVILGITGASGVQYGLKTLETLIAYNHEVDLVVSDSAKKVMSVEYEGDFMSIFETATKIHSITNLGASIASGTSRNEGMIISPCSMKTLAAIATGYTQNLIHRAADCMLKEERRLVLVLRETPLSLVHLKNMLAVKEAGATILPASPGFYYNPSSVEDLINFIVGKTLNVFGVDHSLFKPWDPSITSLRDSPD